MALVAQGFAFWRQAQSTQCTPAQLGGRPAANAFVAVATETDVNAGTGKYGICCTGIDILEANTIYIACTMHSCAVEGRPAAKAFIAVTMAQTASGACVTRTVVTSSHTVLVRSAQ